MKVNKFGEHLLLIMKDILSEVQFWRILLYLSRILLIYRPVACNFILWHRCFPANFAKFLRTIFFTEQLQVTAWEPVTMKKETPTQVFSYEFYQVLKDFFVIEHLRGTGSYLERFLLRFWRHFHNWLWVGKCQWVEASIVLVGNDVYR